MNLRTATEDDREFLVDLFASTRPELAGIEIGGRNLATSQYEIRQRAYCAAYPHADSSIVVDNGRSIGRLLVDRGADAWTIVDVALLPGRRGEGIGGDLIRGVQDEASAAGASVILQVAVDNPAADLYGRLGFADVTAEGMYRSMAWRAA